MLFSKFEVRIVVWSIVTVWTHKVTQEMLIKILNYIKSSCIFFHAKIYAKKILVCEYWHNLDPKNHTRKKASLTKILNFTKSFSFIFYAKLNRNFHFTYYLHTLQTTLYLSYSILVHYLPPNLFIFDLYYSH